MAYFADVVEEEIIFKHQQNISLSKVKIFLKTKVREYLEWKTIK